MSTTPDDFYFLDPAGSDRLLAIPEENPSPTGNDWTPCPAGARLENNHAQCVTQPGDEHLDRTWNVRVRHNQRDQDLIWTSPPWQFVVVHDRLIAALKAEGFSGYSLRPATVRFRDGSLSHDYKRLLVTGWGGLASPESGVGLAWACPGCLLKTYTPLVDAGALIDRSQWTGEDFFVVWPMPGAVLVTGRVAEFLRSSGTKSLTLRVLDKETKSHGRAGFGVGSLGDTFPRALALKYGGRLGIV